MRRREFIRYLGAAVSAWPAAAATQLSYRVGHLVIAAPTDTAAVPSTNWEGFVQGLRDAGYVEGRNVVFEHRSAADRPERFLALAAELTELKVDLIFARGTWALSAAKRATQTIPIVGIDLEIDPIETGLVSSLARPGGNITGLFLDLAELSGKHVQILKEMIPRISRIAVLGNADINASQLRELERVGRSVALETKAIEFRTTTGTINSCGDMPPWK